MQILDALAEKGIINRYQIDDILEKAEEYQGDVERVLIELGVPQDTLLSVKSEKFQVPQRALDSQRISFDLLKYIPEDSARYYKFVPIGVTAEGVLEVGMVNPGDLEARNALQFITSKNNIQTSVFVISLKDFEDVIENYKGVNTEVDDAVEKFEDNVLDVDESMVAGKSPTGLVTNELKIVEDAPVTKMAAVILRHAVEGRASDIHIENTGEKVKIRYRVDGSLHTSLMLPKEVHSALVARIKILAKLKLDEKRKPQDGRFPAQIEGRKIDFRVSTLPTFYGEKVVIRILDPERGVKTLEDTGMRPDHVAMIASALERPYGLILITGPTGSGKTTTLYSMLNKIDREKRNVVSLEDPIEYHISGMNQSQVHPEIGYTFASGLRSILRQDPDVIMVGEIRDKETAQLAIQASLTGHLVFATLHTNNSIGVVPRLVDMGVDPYLIAPTLILAMAQRLVVRLYPGTGAQREVDGGIAEMIEHQLSDLPSQYKSLIPPLKYIYDPQPSEVSASGIQGRVAVYEMFQVTKDVEQVILKNPTEQAIFEQARKNGMLTMKEDAIIKALNKQIPFYEVNGL